MPGPILGDPPRSKDAVWRRDLFACLLWVFLAVPLMFLIPVLVWSATIYGKEGAVVVYFMLALILVVAVFAVKRARSRWWNARLYRFGTECTAMITGNQAWIGREGAGRLVDLTRRAEDLVPLGGSPAARLALTTPDLSRVRLLSLDEVPGERLAAAAGRAQAREVWERPDDRICQEWLSAARRLRLKLAGLLILLGLGIAIPMLRFPLQES